MIKTPLELSAKHKCGTDKIESVKITCQQCYVSRILWHFAEVDCFIIVFFWKVKWNKSLTHCLWYCAAFSTTQDKCAMHSSRFKSEHVWCIIIHLCHTLNISVIVRLLFVALKVIHWFNVRPEVFLYQKADQHVLLFALLE